MNCARLRQTLDAWLDGELDTATGPDIERHVGGCPACAALKEGRVALGQRLRAQAPRYRAPAALEQKIRHSLRKQSRGPTWLQAWAAAAAIAAVSAFAGYWIGRPLPDGSLREQVVASHVASLGGARRLTEIAGDRHAVKPWFQGKVDFAPVVRDLSAEGYVLLGGRVDHVGGGQAAAIVYRVREHVINLFVWRAAAAEDEALSVVPARGFSLATWSDSGLRFAAISDTDAREIERFARLMQARDPR
jgi:anti-sigma factor RsiW